MLFHFLNFQKNIEKKLKLKIFLDSEGAVKKIDWREDKHYSVVAGCIFERLVL